VLHSSFVLNLPWSAEGYVNGGSINGGASLGPETHLSLDGGEITEGACMTQSWMDIYDGFLQGDIEVFQGTVGIKGGIIDGDLIAKAAGYSGIDEAFNRLFTCKIPIKFLFLG
jgi:hypothetical protein